MPRRTGEFCNHFAGLSKPCKAGVSFDDVRDRSVVPNDYPCFNERCAVKCDKATYPTPEEIEQREIELNASMKRIIKIREAIINHCGGGKAVSGNLTCPCCGGTVKYSRAFNGHVHATCSTKGCASWME